MNKKLNLVEILKDCPKGTKLYSPVCGECVLGDIEGDCYPIRVTFIKGSKEDFCHFTKEGRYFENVESSECVLFPSKDNRDWSTFKAAKPKWNPETLQPFDKVLGIRAGGEIWRGDMFIYRDSTYIGLGGKEYDKMIPYNEETKHLLGTNQEAPEFYRI